MTTSTVDCTTGEEVLDHLSPRGKGLLKGRQYYEWAFRGHAIDDKYKLLPLALREEANPFENLYSGPIPNDLEQIRAERMVLLKFCDYVDKMGMAIRENSHNFRQLLAFIGKEQFLHELAIKDSEWIPKDLYAAAALAQHHGLPTRLLDWSWSDLAAAYFAAEEAPRLYAAGKVDKSSRLAVWAFSPDKLSRTCEIAYTGYARR